MHFTNAAKAVFFIVNHLVAAHVPREAVYRRVHDNDYRAKPEYNAFGVSVGSRASHGVEPISNLLMDRAGNSCEPKCRKRCPGKDKIVDPANCRKCLRCPPKTKADPTYNTCIPDGSDKEQKFKDKIKEKIKEWKQKKLEKKKLEKQEKFDDREKRNKVRRLSRCLTIIPLVMGANEAAEYGEEFFDEDYLESLALLDFWPSDMQIEPWVDESSDDLFESDWYLDQWVNFANAGAAARMALDVSAVNGTDVEDIARVTTVLSQSTTHGGAVAARSPRTDLQVHDPHLRKRFFWLIPIFLAAVSAGVRIGTRVGAAATRGAVAITKYTVKIAKGSGSKRSKADKDGAVGKISKNDQWKRCIGKQGPSK